MLPDVDLLRFTTAGSVDDGKSTLIGRLLYDTRSIFQDQMEAIETASRRRGDDSVNLALLTDGLRAEREQNITIDVAYRHFATSARRFIIADAPGHAQYTRNLVTAASTADVAVVLIDARKGMREQSKRHVFIASLLKVPHLVIAVNKMDLVEYSEEAYARIARSFRAFASQLDVDEVVCVPLSALHGDNIVHRSAEMPWYDGPTLLHHLETVDIGRQRNAAELRLPIQYVVRTDQHYRGLAGRVAAGTLTAGDDVVVLPSGFSTRVATVELPTTSLCTAVDGDSIVVTLEDDLAIGRGDMLVAPAHLPFMANRVDALVCWMDEAPLKVGAGYVLLHTGRAVDATIDCIVYRTDVNTLRQERAETLGLNDISRVELTTSQSLVFDAYARNRTTGSFVLADRLTNATVAAGMIAGPVLDSTNVTWKPSAISREEHERRNGHRGAIIWLTGLPASGKTTIATLLEQALFANGCQTMLLDGDHLRHGLNADLGFTDADRRENIRRAGHVAQLFFEQGCIVTCAFVSPFREGRHAVRSLVPDGRFHEIYVSCDLEECIKRDPKGLYARALRGEIPSFTGVSSPYEPPDNPELTLHTQVVTGLEAVNTVLQMLSDAGVVAL